MPDPTRRRALVIVNRKSRRGGGSIESALAVLADAGIELRHEPCVAPDAVVESIRRNANEADLVVLGGGDGTLNAAAPALVDSGLTLGILPLGTANDLARTLEIPADIGEAARVIAGGHVRVIDLGEVNGIPFFNVASLGLSTGVTRALTRDVKRRWGTLAYVVATFRALARMRHFHAEMRVDGVPRKTRSVQIAVGNGRYYGGGLTVADHAEIDDGRLDLYSLETERLWRLALVYPAFRSGRHRFFSEINAVSGTEIEIATRRPQAVSTDGEIATHTPARFRVLPKAVRVLVPALPPA